MRATGGSITSGLVHAVLARRQPVPATGLPVTWAQAVDRLAHAVHRYHDRVEVVPDRALRAELQEAAAVLAAALAAARACARHDGARAVRDLLRAAALCSRAIEAAVGATAARRAGDAEEADRWVTAVREFAVLVAELVDGCAPTDPERRRRFPVR